MLTIKTKTKTKNKNKNKNKKQKQKQKQKQKTKNKNKNKESKKISLRVAHVPTMGKKPQPGQLEIESHQRIYKRAETTVTRFPFCESWAP
jgi:hypothetical protein